MMSVMEIDTKRRTLLIALAGGLAAALAGCLSRASPFADVTRTESRSLTVADGTQLRVDNRNGRVAVEGYDGETVEVEVEISGPSEDAVNAVAVSAPIEDGVLRLVTASRGPFPDRTSVSLTVRCPGAVAIDRIHTTNGPIEATGVAGDPVLETENGPVTARGVEGTVSLATSNGRIIARRIGGLAGATTSNGPIEVDIPSIERDVDVRTENGSIDAALASDLDATLAATTTNGSVELHGLDLSDAETGDSRVSGALGDGRHELTIGTENASIDLRALD